MASRWLAPETPLPLGFLLLHVIQALLVELSGAPSEVTAPALMATCHADP